MGRLKPSVGKIETLDDANSVLKEIGLLEREIESIDSEAHKQIAEIKAEAEKKGKPVRKRIADLAALLGAFAEYNREELFKEKKTVSLCFGSFGYRKTTAISVKKTTVELLKKWGCFNTSASRKSRTRKRWPRWTMRRCPRWTRCGKSRTTFSSKRTKRKSTRNC